MACLWLKPLTHSTQRMHLLPHVRCASVLLLTLWNMQASGVPGEMQTDVEQLQLLDRNLQEALAGLPCWFASCSAWHQQVRTLQQGTQLLRSHRRHRMHTCDICNSHRSMKMPSSAMCMRPARDELSLRD